MKVNNKIVPRCDSAIHLGHLLHTENTTSELIEQAIIDFNKSFNGFIARFGSCFVSTKNKLFQQYCCSMYGSQLWDLTSKTVEKMLTQWRKAHRLALTVPPNTHNDLLPLIADNMSLRSILDCRYLSFYKSIATSKNSIVSFTAKYKLFDSTSTLGKNMTHLLHKYQLDVNDIVTLSKCSARELCYNRWIAKINNEYPLYAQGINEMITMKEGLCYRTLSNEDCNAFINSLSTI